MRRNYQFPPVRRETRVIGTCCEIRLDLSFLVESSADYPEVIISGCKALPISRTRLIVNLKADIVPYICPFRFHRLALEASCLCKLMRTAVSRYSEWHYTCAPVPRGRHW